MNRKKNIIKLSAFLVCDFLFALAFLIKGLCSCEYKGVVGELSVYPPESFLHINEYDFDITGIDVGGVTYFCLPSYCNLDYIYQSKETSEALIFNANGDLLTDPQIGELQDVYVSMDEEATRWRVCFMRSANIDSLFIELGGYDIDDIEHDTLSDASIRVVDKYGCTTFEDEDIYIKGRGNGTWDEEKKSYEFRLKEKETICGLSRSKRWTLLANHYPDIAYKLGLDLPRMLDMEYVIDSEYVDLYVNGIYRGNYILCKEPHIGSSDLNINNLQSQNESLNGIAVPFLTANFKGYIFPENPSNITGGYLIEKSFGPLSEINKPSAFRNKNNTFCIKSPRYASQEELTYIAGFVNKVDSSICGRGLDQLDFIDMYSFARWYLIEEFLYNCDAEVASRYFYKKANDDTLYAGPVWDTEASCGTYTHYDGFLNWNNWIKDSEQYLPYYKEPILWDKLLFENAEYRGYLAEVFSEYFPYFYEIINSYIDETYDKIRPSINMDRAVWGDNNEEMEHYLEYDNVIRFLKFWLYNRLCCMVELLDTDIKIPEKDFSKALDHTVTFLLPDGQIRTMVVEDGAQLEEELYPEIKLDHSRFDGWMRSETGEIMSYYVPVYEDIIFVPKPPCPVLAPP